MSAPIVFNVGTLPEGFCWTTPQSFANALSEILTGYLPGESNTFNYGNTIPDANDRNKPWYRLDSDGNPDRWYVFNNGLWISPHAVPAGSSVIQWWEGTLDALKTFEGGVDEAITSTTGPFWQEVTSMAGRFPLHPGTLGTTPATTVVVGDTGGEVEHELTEAELPEHRHAISNLKQDRFSRNDLWFSAFSSPLGTFGNTAPSTNTDNTGDGEAHNNMPPYRGIYAIKRTARVYYKV